MSNNYWEASTKVASLTGQAVGDSYKAGYKQGYLEGRKVLMQELNDRYGSTKWRAGINE